MMTDVIDRLAGIRPGSALDAARARRLKARRQAQASHDALSVPEEPGEVALEEQRALAAYVCGLHGEAVIEAFHAEGRLAAGGHTGSHLDRPLPLAALEREAWMSPCHLLRAVQRLQDEMSIWRRVQLCMRTA